MVAEYDIFLSHAWADGDRPGQIAAALTAAGLRVWFDAQEINDFASITRAVTEGLAQSKALLAYYSKTYPLRRACQWELTAAFLAAQHIGDPRSRVLIINPEEHSDHIHPMELRDAKFRNAPKNDSVALQELVQSIIKHVAGLDGLLADIHPFTAPHWYGRTPVGSTRFVGRLAEMWQVHSLLHLGDVIQITGANAATGGVGRVSGLGGVGKSLLVEEYALHFGAFYPGGVFWIRAYGNDDAKSAFGPEQTEAMRSDQVRQMAERWGIDASGKTEEQIEGALARKIESEGKRCLWIVDDVPNGWDGETLRRWFAPHALARTLITTRSCEYGSLTRGIDLSELSPDEAAQLLTSRRKPAGRDEEEHARGLAKDLGYHALALDVTASALLSSVAAQPFADFRAKFARTDKDALVLAETLADALPNGHEKSIAHTVLRSIRGLGAEGLDFLRLSSILAVAPIPASLVTAVFEEADNLTHEKAEENATLAFQQVTAASLAEIEGENQDARAVHTLVSRVVRFQEKCVPGRTEALRVAVIKALRSQIAQATGDPRLHRQIELQVEHARHVATILATLDEAKLVGCVARYDYERGAYTSARALLMHEVEFRRHAQGLEHPATLTAMSNLAETLREQGDYAAARRLQEQVLETRTRERGEEHPDTLMSMSSLAGTLVAQGDYAEAQWLEEWVLKISPRVLDEDPTATLRSMHNLAGILNRQGDYAGAQQLEARVLEVSMRVLGEEHAYTLGSMNNLADILVAQGDHVEAQRLQERVLEVRTRVLGEEHPVTLASMNNLAAILFAQGDYAGAQRLEDRVMEVTPRVLGEEHPHMLTSMNNLAGILNKQGDYAGARRLLERVLEAATRMLGDAHPDTLLLRNNLAEILRGQGAHAEAQQLHERVLEVRKRVLGDEHPDTLGSMCNLGHALLDVGDATGALRMLRNCVAAQRRVLGEQHPDTIRTAKFLKGLEDERRKELEKEVRTGDESKAYIAQLAGQYEMALKYLEEAIRNSGELGSRGAVATAELFRLRAAHRLLDQARRFAAADKGLRESIDIEGVPTAAQLAMEICNSLLQSRNDKVLALVHFIKAELIWLFMEEERKRKTTANVVRLCKQGLTVLVEGLRFRRNRVALVMLLRRGCFECEMGNAFQELGNEKEALASYKRAINVLAQVDGRATAEGGREPTELALYKFGLFKKAQCCLQIAHIYARKRWGVSTIKTYKIAVAATRAYMQYTDEPLSEKMFVEAVAGLGDSQRTEDLRSALATYVELADFCKAPGSHVADHLGSVLSRVGWVHSELKEWEAARQQYADALAAFSQVIDPDAKVLCEIGFVYHNLSQLPVASTAEIYLHLTHAIAAFEEAIQKDAHNVDAVSKKATSSMVLAINIRRSNPVEARQLFEGAITALESRFTLQSENEVLLQTKARVLEKFAVFEGVSGRLEQAIPKLQESMNLYHLLRILHPKQAQLAHEEATILNLLGEAYRFTKQEALALETLKRALTSIHIALKGSPQKAEYLKTFDEIAQHFDPKPTLRNIGLRSVKKSP